MQNAEMAEYLRNLNFEEAGKLTLVDLLEKRTQATPEGIAVRCPAGQISYKNWHHKSKNIAARIKKSAQYERNSAILVWVDTEDARKIVCAQHAVLEASCMIAPLDDRLSVAEVKRFAGDVKATGAVVSRSLLLSSKGGDLTEEMSRDESLIGDSKDLIFFSIKDSFFEYVGMIDESIDELICSNQDAFEKPNPDDCALLAFTSGTTGRPKAAMIAHGGCVQLAERMVNDIFAAPRGGKAINNNDVIQSPVPAYLPTSIVNTLYAAVLAGCPLSYRGRRFDPVAEELEMVNAGTTVYAGAPSHYAMMCQLPESENSKSSKVEVMTASGGPMTVLHYQTMQKRWPKTSIANWYALNETMVGQTLNYGFGMEIDPASVGKPIWPTELSVVNDAGHICMPGEIGEILLRAHGQMTGYYLNDDETVKRIDKDGWIHTDDTGFVGKEDGLLRITGRKGDRINRGGFKFYPIEVEEVLLGHSKLADAAVLAVPDAVLGQDLVGFVVARKNYESKECDEADIRQYCQERLSRNKVPSRIYIVKQLPRSGFGKVVKKDLIQMWEKIESQKN